MLSFPFFLRTDYREGAPVSSSDLNRRARILNAQLPGALRAAGLVAGILPLWKPETGLPEAGLPFDQTARALAMAAQNALLVEAENGQWRANAGAALVELGDATGGGPLVYTQTDGLSIPVQTPDAGQTLYLHLALQIPVLGEDGAPGTGALDSLMGDAPRLLVSDTASEPNALLLASVNDAGVLTDQRSLALPVMLAQEMARLRARLDALDAPVTDPGTGTGNGSGVSGAQFGALQKRVSDLEAALADLKAQIAQGNNDSVVGVSETPASLLVNSGKIIGQIVNLDPSSARHFLAGIDMPDATGDAQNLNGLAQRVVRIGGNAAYNRETGVISGANE